MAHETRSTIDDGMAPPVRIEPCAELRVDYDADWPVCAACGWLEDEHASAVITGAVVTDLPRRHAPQLRKAS